jgi:pyrroline-5-carboxylate reductase
LGVAAERLGLRRQFAEELAARTMLGTGALLVKEGIKPSELCAAVASPGGTTEAGLKVMQSGGIEALAEKAMSAAVKRAKELAKGG